MYLYLYGGNTLDDDPFIRLMTTFLSAQTAPASGGESVFGAILLQIILIALNAVFACAEIAIISINDTKLIKLAENGNKKASRLLKLTEQPSRFLATIQVGITAVNLLGSAFAADNFSELITAAIKSTGIGIPESVIKTISVVLITVILLYFTVVFGELVPKRVAMRNADKLALALSGLVSFISAAFKPIVWLLTASTNGILRLFGIDPNAEEEEVTEEEIRMMVDVGSEKGTIDMDEKEMIQNVFEFDNINADDIITHRTEVSMLWLEESDEQWGKTIRESRHSMYPVCGESVDDIVGILNSKDYFRLEDKSRENVLKKALKPAYFVPETVRADVLFSNMKKSRNHFAVVLDEYGGMSGIVTIYDLLEQLVGDLEDDKTVPEEEPLIERIDSQTWKIHGTAPLDEVAVQLGIELPAEEYETFSGLVFGLIGTVPDDGSTPEIEGFGLVIKVMEIREHRLEKAVVYKQTDKATEKTDE